jgi:hypothetical protein
MATLTPQSLAQQREKLYEQIRNASRQQAQQAYQQAMGELRNQLQSQRLQMNQNRGQLAEQAYMAQRSVQNQAQARGLGSSGLAALGAFQAQQQAGQAVNQLEAQNQEFQRAAMDTRKSLMNELTAALRSADLAHGQQMAESANQQYSQERAEKEFNISTLTELLNLAAMDKEKAKMLAELMFGGGEIPTGSDLDNLLEAQDPANKYNPLEQEVIKTNETQSGWENILDFMSNWLSPTYYLGKAAQGLFGADEEQFNTEWANAWTKNFLPGVDDTIRLIENAINGGKEGSLYRKTLTYTLGDDVIETYDRVDAQNKITDWFAKNYKEVANGSIKIDVGNDGVVSFMVGKTKHPTLADALKDVREKQS